MAMYKIPSYKSDGTIFTGFQKYLIDRHTLFFYYKELRSRVEVQICYFWAFLNQKIRYEFVILKS